MTINVTPIPRLIDLAVPAFTLGTTNAAGDAETAVASNSTLLAFDATLPDAITFGQSGSAGSAVVTSRRDHAHAMASLPETTSVYTGSFTRDTTTASGTQAITGVGFTVKAVILLASQSASAGEASWGLDDGTSASHQVLFDYNNTGSDSYSHSSNYSIIIYESGSAKYEGYVSALGTDGFTITWVKTGSPSGTIYISFMAIG
jgi:hypothetical protein|tara:strand:- start:387 stop:995 length:609 start_codon:yes stop_codon:yes gene_type:complete